RTCTSTPATRHAPGSFLSSGTAGPAPEAPDSPQFPLHGARRTTQTGGDLLDGETFHLPDGHRAEDVVAEPAEQTAALVGQQGGEFGRRLTTDNLDGAGVLLGRGVLGLAPVAFGALFVADLSPGLA